MPTYLCTNRVRAERVRTETLDGADYLVVPDVAVGKPAHLDGGYIPEDVWRNTQDEWNGRPLPVGHPTDAWGNNVSANAPTVREQAVVGWFYNAQYDETTSELQGELWINKEKARELGGHAEAVLDQLANGNGLDVSTAYSGVQGEPGTYDGEHRDEVLVDIRPDHVALLPDALGPGNLTTDDGAGVPEDVAITEVATPNAEGDDGAVAANDAGADGTALFVNARTQARTPEYSGTTSGEWSAPTFNDFASAYDGETPDSVADAPSDFTTWAANHTLLGEATADAFDDLSVFPVVEPSSGNLNANAIRAVLSGRGEQADVSDGALESAQTIAGRLLNDEFGGEAETDTDTNSEPNANAGVDGGVDDELADAVTTAAGDENTRGVLEAVRDILRLSSNDTSGTSDDTAGSDAPDSAGTADDTDATADADADHPADSDTDHPDNDTNSPMTDDNDNDYDIERLAEQTPFDPATLDGMPPEQLEYVAANADEEGDPEADPEDEDEQPEDAPEDDSPEDAHAESERDVGDRDADAEDAADDDDVNANGDVASKLDALAEQIDGLEERFPTREEFETELERHANSDSREQYIQTILANGGEDEWDESELREEDTDDLRRLADLAGGVSTNGQQTGADFGLQPTAPPSGGVNTNDDDDGPDGPKTTGTMADYLAQKKEGGD